MRRQFALVLFGDRQISDLRIPPAVAATRTDELWRHTCFEAFICNSPGPAYYEFNFASSTQWAAYWFDSYRSGMHVATEISAPRIGVRSSRTCYRLQASLEMSQMSSLRIDGAWRIGLAAVIEEMSGHKSDWALVLLRAGQISIIPIPLRLNFPKRSDHEIWH
jgi:hypothetical protein